MENVELFALIRVILNSPFDFTLQGYDNLCMNRYHRCMEKKINDDCDRSIFTLSRSIPYQIMIAGRPSENWSDWLGEVDFQTEIESSGFPTTALTGTFDQAALIGLLRQLYSLGYPLISVSCIQMPENERGPLRG